MGNQSGKVFQFVWSTTIDRRLWLQKKHGHKSQTSQPKRIFVTRNFSSTSNISLCLSLTHTDDMWMLLLFDKYIYMCVGWWVGLGESARVPGRPKLQAFPSTFIFWLQRSKTANGKTDIKWQFTGDHFAQRVIVSYRDMYGRARTNGTSKPVDCVPLHSPSLKLIFRTPHMKIVWRGLWPHSTLTLISREVRIREYAKVHRCSKTFYLFYNNIWWMCIVYRFPLQLRRNVSFGFSVSLGSFFCSLTCGGDPVGHFGCKMNGEFVDVSNRVWEKSRGQYIKRKQCTIKKGNLRQDGFVNRAKLYGVLVHDHKIYVRSV